MKEQKYALHTAIMESDEDKARELIVSDVSLVELNDDDWSPLHLCGQTNNDRIARWLINAGAKVNQKNSKGVTPLHSCCWTNSVQVAQLLLKSGVNPNLKDNSSWTPVMLAAWNNNYKIIELLVSNGASINARSKTGSTALHFAAYNGAPLALEVLLENKASTNISNDEGIMAYDLAVRKKNSECMQLLEARTSRDASKSNKISSSPIAVNTSDYFNIDIGTPAGDTLVLTEEAEDQLVELDAKKNKNTKRKGRKKATTTPSSTKLEDNDSIASSAFTLHTGSFSLDNQEVDMPFLTELTKEQSRFSSDGHSRELLFPEQLVNITFNGEKLRRKSEVVIANLLFSFDINYVYERKLCGTVCVGINYPAFSIFTQDDRIIVWEHISSLNTAEKRKQLNQLKRWYKLNGFIDGETFFTTQDSIEGGVDSQAILEVAEKVQEELEKSEKLVQEEGKE